MAARKKVCVPVNALRDAEFDRAFELLRDLVDWSAADQEFPVRGNAVYTTSVVLWMLVSQRMNPEGSLEAAVKRLLETQPDFLPRNKRVAEKTLSAATGAYSRARSRLRRDAARWFAERVRQSLIAATAPSLNGRRVYLLDGTTITLAPEPALIVADEPTGNLDARTGAIIADLLFSITSERAATLVLVTHDESLAARAHRTVRLHEGRVHIAQTPPAP